MPSGLPTKLVIPDNTVLIIKPCSAHPNVPLQCPLYMCVCGGSTILYSHLTCSFCSSVIQPVAQIVVSDQREATGVVLEDGSEIRAKVVLSNATPKVTFLDLLAEVSVCRTVWIISLSPINCHIIMPGKFDNVDHIRILGYQVSLEICILIYL